MSYINVDEQNNQKKFYQDINGEEFYIEESNTNYSHAKNPKIYKKIQQHNENEELCSSDEDQDSDHKNLFNKKQVIMSSNEVKNEHIHQKLLDQIIYSKFHQKDYKKESFNKEQYVSKDLDQEDKEFYVRDSSDSSIIINYGVKDENVRQKFQLKKEDEDFSNQDLLYKNQIFKQKYEGFGNHDLFKEQNNYKKLHQEGFCIKDSSNFLVMSYNLSNQDQNMHKKFHQEPGDKQFNYNGSSNEDQENYKILQQDDESEKFPNNNSSLKDIFIYKKCQKGNEVEFKHQNTGKKLRHKHKGEGLYIKDSTDSSVISFSNANKIDQDQNIQQRFHEEHDNEFYNKNLSNKNRKVYLKIDNKDLSNQDQNDYIKLHQENKFERFCIEDSSNSSVLCYGDVKNQNICQGIRQKHEDKGFYKQDFSELQSNYKKLHKNHKCEGFFIKDLSNSSSMSVDNIKNKNIYQKLHEKYDTQGFYKQESSNGDQSNQEDEIENKIISKELHQELKGKAFYFNDSSKSSVMSYNDIRKQNILPKIYQKLEGMGFYNTNSFLENQNNQDKNNKKEITNPIINIKLHQNHKNEGFHIKDLSNVSNINSNNIKNPNISQKIHQKHEVKESFNQDLSNDDQNNNKAEIKNKIISKKLHQDSQRERFYMKDLCNSSTMNYDNANNQMVHQNNDNKYCNQNIPYGDNENEIKNQVISSSTSYDDIKNSIIHQNFLDPNIHKIFQQNHNSSHKDENKGFYLTDASDSTIMGYDEFKNHNIHKKKYNQNIDQKFQAEHEAEGFYKKNSFNEDEVDGKKLFESEGNGFYIKVHSDSNQNIHKKFLGQNIYRKFRQQHKGKKIYKNDSSNKDEVVRQKFNKDTKFCKGDASTKIQKIYKKSSQVQKDEEFGNSNFSKSVVANNKNIDPKIHHKQEGLNKDSSNKYQNIQKKMVRESKEFYQKSSSDGVDGCSGARSGDSAYNNELSFGRKSDILNCIQNADTSQNPSKLNSSKDQTDKFSSKNAEEFQKSNDKRNVLKLSRFRVKQIRVTSVEASPIHDKDAFSKNEEDFEDLSEKAQQGSLEKTSTEEKLNTTPSGSDFLISRDSFHYLMSQVKSRDWSAALNALIEISELAHTFDWRQLYAHMTEINQRLIELLRSPRSLVCRSCCKIAGKFFESIKDTRRPEYDEIVELLLCKSADFNQFIRQDANIALDSLVMHVPPFHTVRAISQKGPTHKNDLIRTTTARLFVCIVGIAGTNLILNHAGNEFTRKRIVTHMVMFIKDRNMKTREYGERLYLLLRDHPNFEMYLNKLVKKNSILEMRKILKTKS